MDNLQRIELMTERLNAALSPESLAISDDSHLHAGHAGAQSGKGHFTVNIKSAKFVGVRPLKQHQMIYAALGELMETDIHALAIKATC